MARSIGPNSPRSGASAHQGAQPNYAGEHDPEFHKRFFLEASIASKLTHPNTVTIFDYGRTEDDIYYMAMEYLEGHTLHRAIREASHFPRGARGSHRPADLPRLREAHSLASSTATSSRPTSSSSSTATDRLREGARLRLVKNVSGDGKGRI